MNRAKGLCVFLSALLFISADGGGLVLALNAADKGANEKERKALATEAIKCCKIGDMFANKGPGGEGGSSSIIDPAELQMVVSSVSEQEPSVNSATCYNGMGLYYRGTISRSKSGRWCVEWDTRERLRSADVQSGRHNYCRNPNYRKRPWCYVMKKNKRVQEFCNIPTCFGPGPPFFPTPTEAGTEALPHTLKRIAKPSGIDVVSGDRHYVYVPIYEARAVKYQIHFSARTEIGPLNSPAESTCGQRYGKHLKIVGGAVTTVESQPWMVALFLQSKTKQKVFRCGGSLIAPCWVLTAAHCFPDGPHTEAQKLSVTLGKSALNETDRTIEQTFKVQQVFIHEGFDNSEGNFNHDMALLKLKAKNGRCVVETRSVKTVCLPPPHQSLRAGYLCEIAGYGKEKKGLWYSSQYLREAKVNLVAHAVCRDKEYYGDAITENMICAGRPDWRKDSCEGDSGGPLVCEVDNRMFLFGIVSWGDGCAKEYRPGVYTTVTNYNQWIEKKTGLSTITSVSTFPIKVASSKMAQ